LVFWSYRFSGFLWALWFIALGWTCEWLFVIWLRWLIRTTTREKQRQKQVTDELNAKLHGQIRPSVQVVK
jgi:hypothetical protein